MKKSIFFLAAFALVATSCSDDLINGESQEQNKYFNEFSAHVVEFDPITTEHTITHTANGPRRTAVIIDGNTPKFRWLENDQLGIYSAEVAYEVISRTFQKITVTKNSGVTVSGYEAPDGFHACAEKDKPNGTTYIRDKKISKGGTYFQDTVTRTPSEVPVATSAGQYTFFNVKSIETATDGHQRALFAQPNLAVKNGDFYFAFSPFLAEATKGTEINIDYSQQMQTGNGTYDHLGAKDFMYSALTQAKTENIEDLTDFEMKHIGAIVRLKLQVPEGGLYTECQVVGHELLTGGTFNLATSQFTNDPSPDGIITIKMGENGQGIAVEEGGYITVYVMFPAQDLTDHDHYMCVKLKNIANKTFETSILPGINVEAGKAYGITTKVKVTGGYDEDVPGGAEYVDLDPENPETSMKWASYNVGAPNKQPYETGDWYAWGEIQTKSTFPTNCSNYEWATTTDGASLGSVSNKKEYKATSSKTYHKLRKYVPTTDVCAIYNGDNGTTPVDIWAGEGERDGKTRLDLEDDAAYVHMGGNKWRMPTADEMSGLVYGTRGYAADGKTPVETSYEWVWTTMHEVPGYYIYNTKYGNFIFLPACGRMQSSLSYGANESDLSKRKGYYWCSDLEDYTADGKTVYRSNRAYHYGFFSPSASANPHEFLPDPPGEGENRFEGRQIRAIYMGSSWVAPEDE